jgi:hypothetical protein
MTTETEEQDVPEVAVVMTMHDGQSYFVMGRGPIIESDVEGGLDAHECGPVAFAPKERGLWIWEGHPGWYASRGPEGIDEGGEPIYKGCGAWRRLTPEEAARIVSGDFDLFGPERLMYGEVEDRADKLFAGLALHVESEAPLPPGTHTVEMVSASVDPAGHLHVETREKKS